MKAFLKNVNSMMLFLPMITLVTMVLVEVAGIIAPMLGIQASGIAEITSHAGAFTISFCMYFGTLEKYNVRVHFLTEKLRGKMKTIVESVVHLISSAAIFLLLWPALMYSFNSIREGEFSTLLHIPIYPFRFIFSLSLILMLLAVVFRLYKSVLILLKTLFLTGVRT